MINVKNLTKYYGPTLAIEDVSFKVQKGEVVGFLGPNGAGKTTTMKILTCYMPASSGEADIAGHDVFTGSLEVRKLLGYVPENAPVYREMVVRDYLDFIGAIRRMPSRERRRAIKEKVELCGLGPVVRRPINELSKGFIQRVCLAQALLHDPEILILDEPTSGLDPNQIIEIRELIKTIGKEKTIILCSHILPEVSATCSRIMIINRGRIVAKGTPGELQDSIGGMKTVWATFRGEAKPVTEKLQLLDSVHKIREDVSPGAGLVRFSLQASKESAVCEQIFQCAVKNKWIMSELREEELSLEDVFTRLTTMEGGANA